VTSNCGTSLAPGAQCTISVTFTPSLLGPRTATVTVTDSEGTQTASLTGTGTGPLYSVNPAALSFPNTVVSTASAAQQLIVRNNQTTPMTITTRTLGGLFGTQYAIATGTTCAVGQVVASGLTCVINVTFNPQAVFGLGGIRLANLTLAAAGLQTNVPLSGTAILFPVDVTPKGFFGINGQLIYPNTVIGQASVTEIATLSNYQNTAVTVNSIAMPSQFRIVTGALTTCTNGGVLPPAAANGTPSTCQVAIQFVPTAQNLFCIFGICLNMPWMQNATFNLSGSGGVNPTILLIGTALPRAAVGFSWTNGGTVGAWGNAVGARIITVRNTGPANSSLSLSAVPAVANLTGGTQFNRTGGTCSATTVLAQNQACTVQVTRTRPASTPFAGTGTLTITDTGAATGAQVISLTGT
jgi:hypothetical protein